VVVADGNFFMWVSFKKSPYKKITIFGLSTCFIALVTILMLTREDFEKNCWGFATFLSESFEKDLNKSLWNYENYSSDNVQLVSSPVFEGTRSIQFIVKPGEIVNNGNRAEVVLKNSDPICNEAWYRWSFYLPSSYIDAPSNKWQLFGQWHDQPDKSKGETWVNYPAHSPMLSYLYYFINNTCYLKLSYGVGSNRTIVGSIPFTKGTWNTITTHVYWSRTDRGFVESWLNQTRFNAFNGYDYKYYGINMYNDAPAYLKIGVYRDSTINVTNRVYFDKLIRSPRPFE